MNWLSCALTDSSPNAVNSFSPHDAIGDPTLADAVLDRVFESTPNDLVVPEPGVFGENGNGAFPIATSHVLQVPAAQGVIHTTLFGYPPVGARLLDWLTPL
mgnify:CR=1 FL=1